MKINKNDYKKFLLVGFPIVFLLLAFVIVLTNAFSGDSGVKIETGSLKEISTNANTDTKFSYTMVADDKLANLAKPGKDGVIDFLNKLENSKDDAYLPSNFSKNATFIRTESEASNDKRDHYFLTQTLNGKKVFGSYFTVHSKNNTSVYFLSANLTKNTAVEKMNITNDDAKNIALSKAIEEDVEERSYNVYPPEEVVFNRELFGYEDPKNYPTAVIRVESDDDEYLFDKKYYINLTNGEILLIEDLMPSAKQRNVYNCHESASSASCTRDRTEGSSPVADAEVNRSYDILGEIYDYYSTNFSRDSIDGAGLPLNAYVHKILVNSAGQNKCPNASYGGGTMYYCTGLVIEDVTAHEFTHGVTGSTAGLVYQSQSGALNEAISDIFASNFDDNWTIGEGSSLGVIRDMQNPPAVRNGSLGYYPDRLFSQNYYCGYADNEGVHHNSSIPNKAYFLMTDGGTFNGCTVNGIGRTRSQKIMYQALTRYMNSSSNFRHAYTAIVQACDDLYASEAGVCDQVTRALQATEMDQQPAGTMAGPKCSSVTPQTPACAGGGSGPGVTITPFPTTGSGGGTTPGNYKVSGKVYIDTDNSGTFNSGDTPYSGATLDLSDGPKSGSTTTNSSGDYVLADYPSGLYTLTLSILGSKKEEKPVTFGPNAEIDFRIFSSQTEPTIVPKPTIKAGPTIGDGPSPTPTPVPHICEFDPSCTAQKKNLQLCKLICRPK